MKRFLFFLLFCLGLQINAYAFTLDLSGWQQVNDKHFKVIFKRWTDTEFPRQILNKAEGYYSSIADDLGYSRYQNFWTWDDKVSIVYFSSQEEYAKMTGQPAWSKGFAINHLSSVNLRIIVTYQGQENFLDTVLPHEISHLILHDFIGANKTIPMWFDEGVAQMAEAQDDQDHKRIFAHVIQSGHSIPLSLLQNPLLAIRNDATQGAIFYAESLYIVDFLVKTYGKERFINVCRNLRDGKELEDALKSAYYPTIDSMATLQDKWIQYMMQYL